jgi:hypothetical protein
MCIDLEPGSSAELRISAEKTAVKAQARDDGVKASRRWWFFDAVDIRRAVPTASKAES